MQALRAVETNAGSPLRDDLHRPPPSAAGYWGIQKEPSRVDSDCATRLHEILPWGSHYRNLVSQWDMREWQRT